MHLIGALLLRALSHAIREVHQSSNFRATIVRPS
jgi:hypothetical protein